MSHIVQTDAQGTLVLPAGLAPPNTAFTVEASGDVVILRRQPDGESVDSITAAAQIEWLRSWIASLPPGPSIPEEATHRDTMYD